MRDFGLRFGIAVAVIATAALALPLSAGATTYTVDNTGLTYPGPDDGICQLYEALEAADSGTDLNDDCPEQSEDDIIQLQGGVYSLPIPLNIDNLPDTHTITLKRVDGTPVTLDSTGGGSTARVIFTSAGELTVDGLTLTGGSVTNGSFGAGIGATGALTSVTVLNSTITGNSASETGGDGDGDGGGIGVNLGPAVTVTNSTISGNTAEHRGGGISADGPLTLNNVTITKNTADFGATSPVGGRGGGVICAGCTPTLNNSIIAANIDENAATNNAPDCSGLTGGTFTGSLVGDNTGCGFVDDATNDIGAPIGIATTLASNGGPTQTHAVTGPRALDLGAAACPPFDQRGFTRTAQGAGCDRGAVEAQEPVLAPIGSKTVQAGQALTFTVTATDLDVGDMLTLGSANLPFGATFNGLTGEFSWTPTVAQVGDHPSVQFTATDSTNQEGFEAIMITVTPVPVSTPPPGGSTPPATGPTGLRAAALKKCAKVKNKAKKKKCKKRARQLPV